MGTLNTDEGEIKVKILNAIPSVRKRFFAYRGFFMPLKLVLMTGGGPSNFDEIAAHHFKRLNEELKISEGDRLLEIGCGIGRDAINFLNSKPRISSYLGIDIIGPSIEWCSKNISRRDRRFKFHHFNIQDALHNPGGSLGMNQVRLPVEDSSIDKVFGWSVLTHLPEADIRSYFEEIKRVLSPSGSGFFSFFLVNEEVLLKAAEVNLTPFNLKFDHQISESCYVNDLANPLGAVAYKSPLVDQMLSEAGLERVGEFHKGSWSGYWSDVSDGQDGFTFRHAAPKR